MTWTWGDVWIGLVAALAIGAAALTGQPVDFWIVLVALAAALGWFLLNLLQVQLSRVSLRPPVYDQEAERSGRWKP